MTFPRTSAKVVVGVVSFISSQLAGADILVRKVEGNLEKAPSLELFKEAKEEKIDLMAQPMMPPRPETTNTDRVFVKAIHNKNWIAFLLRWSDTEKSEGGRPGSFSDAVALQFPVKDHQVPPPVFMGAKDNPVHIYHWRAQYQLDKEKGMRTMKDFYPNMMVDMYPMEFPDMGTLTQVDESKREIYSYGKAAGNPQSYVKKGVDEMLAEGFGSSAVVENVFADARGEWVKGEWTVVISRPLKREGASTFPENGQSHIAFAVWQGGKDEVGSRKSVTMSWTPLKIE